MHVILLRLPVPFLSWVRCGPDPPGLLQQYAGWAGMVLCFLDGLNGLAVLLHGSDKLVQPF